MRAPLRPRFQRPRTQLVHLLLDVQPPARVPDCCGRWFCRSDSIVYNLRCAARRTLDVNPSRVNTSERTSSKRMRSGISKMRSRRLRSDDRSDRVHLEVLSDRHRHVGDNRDCIPGKKCARSWCAWSIIVINRGRFPKASGKIVKIGRVILRSSLMGVKMRERLDALTCFASTCEKRMWNAARGFINDAH